MDRKQKMLINCKKSKTIIFNFTENFQFTTRLKIKEENLEIVNSTKLLGTVITNDLKWDKNTAEITRKANARMQLLRKAASFSPPAEDLKDIYVLFIRSILEQSATVWHSSLTEENSDDLERIQKSAMKIILADKYQGYQQALARLGLDTLKSRREKLCLIFAKKCVQNQKLKHMFPENINLHNMKHRKTEKYQVQFARLQKSPIVYMQKLLNQDNL